MKQWTVRLCTQTDHKTYRSALMINSYSVNLSLRTTISTGLMGGGTLIRPSFDLAFGSLRDFLPLTASTSTAPRDARRRGTGVPVLLITWNILTTDDNVQPANLNAFDANQMQCELCNGITIKCIQVKCNIEILRHTRPPYCCLFTNRKYSILASYSWLPPTVKVKYYKRKLLVPY